MKTHTEGPPERRPEVGDTVEVRLPELGERDRWYRVKVVPGATSADGFAVADDQGRVHFGFNARLPGPWRWPEGTTHCPDAVQVREPLPGDLIEIPSGVRRGRWRSRVVRETFPGSSPFRFTAGSRSYYVGDHGDTWRWPQVPAAVVTPEAQRLEVDQRGGPDPAIPEDPEQPNDRQAPPVVRRCGEVVGRLDNGAPELCEVQLGPDLRCVVCGGLRCWTHCGGLQHNAKPALIAQGNVGEVCWAVYATGIKTFGGQLWRDGGRVLDNVQGDDSEVVTNTLLARVDVLVGAIGSGSWPAEVPPGTSAELAAGGELLAAAELADRVRRIRIADAVRDWLREAEPEWERLAYDLPETADRAKSLHDRQVLRLFAAIGGAL